MDRRHHAVTLSTHGRDALMALSGVVSVGVGVGPEGEPAVIVGVRNVSAAIRDAIPECLEDIPVILREVGEISGR
ncbi:MAG: hypothetical protein IBX63_05645 [Coriobacteriia bacterium]|nr:hypothetical protein [Coriobacteriia bacterium]